MPYQYQCSHADQCPNKICQHNDIHLARRLTVMRGNYQTCASNHLYCRYVKDYVICGNIAVKQPSVKVENWNKYLHLEAVLERNKPAAIEPVAQDDGHLYDGYGV